MHDTIVELELKIRIKNKHVSIKNLSHLNLEVFGITVIVWKLRVEFKFSRNLFGFNFVLLFLGKS